ncbi:MAG: FtsX-like permease family protein [Roseivirga sp.]|nr:FtsX-like permease family protein [Roseivirga sp.]
MNKPKPPQLPLKLLRLFCAKHRIEELEGDLYEEFIENLESKDIQSARRRYTWTIIRSFRRYIFEYQPQHHKPSYLTMMISHYIKTALRSIRANKTLTLINLTGLSAGIASSLIIILFVADQYLLDDFIPDREHIVRLEGQSDNYTRVGFTPLLHPGLGPAIANMSPNVESFTCLNKAAINIKVKQGKDIVFFKESFLFVDSSFFQLFPFELLKGHPDKVFENSKSVVLTERMAIKLFGSEDPMGKTVNTNLGRSSFIVTGILKDIPANSSLQFDLLSVQDKNHSLNSGAFGPVPIYLKLVPGTDPEALAQQFSKEIGNLTENEFIARQQYRFTPFDQIKYNTGSTDRVIPAMNKKVIDLFVFLAIFILLLATINYINLSAARALRRGQEAGIRKVIGAGRRSFTMQFLTESLLLCWLTLPIALLLTHACLPAFENVLQKQLFNTYLTDPIFLLIVFGLVSLLGLAAGIYPSVIISRFRFTDFLKGKIGSSRKGNLFRKGLVIFQFTISIILILGTLMVERQLEFIQKRTLSFQGDQILVCNRAISTRLTQLKNTLAGIPSVKSVSLTTSPPGGDDAYMYGFNKTFGEIVYWHEIDENYTPLLQLRMLQGKAFDKEEKGSLNNQILVNETMAKLIETSNPLNSETPLSETYTLLGEQLRIRGVIEDFHIQSLHERIKPMIFTYSGSNSEAGSLMIKITPTDMGKTMARINESWKEFIPDIPLNATFLNSRFESLYTAEVRLGKVFGIFSLLAVLISCMGLFGLSLHVAEVKTKEIGIRKVLGASVTQIMSLLSVQTYILIGVATLIAAPIAWYFGDLWLREFAYRQNLSIGTLILTLLTCLTLATLTTVWHTIKTARVSPANTLRNE